MFINKMKKTLNDDFNYAQTENAALGYRTTGKALLDINFKVATLRSADESQIIDYFMKAFYEDKLLALKWLFYARDAREGLGERRLFRVVAAYLARHNPEAIQKSLQYVPVYGRFDDLWCVLDTPLAPIVVDIIKAQLEADESHRKQEQPISLLAKWLPSPNTSSKATVAMARRIMQHLGMSEAVYRKRLSTLRKYLDVVEVKMSDRQWGEIHYETVPSKANLLYKDAFMRHDEERRTAFLSALAKGETKINASVLYPHDIVHRYFEDAYYGVLLHTDATLEALWKALPDTVNKAVHGTVKDAVKESVNTIVVADGSGSMRDQIGNTQVSALSVANGLAIYFAERNSGQFKDCYITFSENPQLVHFTGSTTLREKIEIALRYDEVANTNIEAVFDLILKTAVNEGMTQSALPQNILIVSDMEFDDAVDREPDQRLFAVIAEKYAQHGYKLPRLVFWNVNSRTGTIPVVENELGVALVSGFSVNIVDMVLSGALDPYQCLLNQLLSERYAKITLS